MSAQRSLINSAWGFDIVPSPHGFVLVDLDTFNNWGVMDRAIATEDEAVDYAYRCYQFKIGRTVRI